MAIFGKKTNQTTELPYVDGLYPADGEFASPVVANEANNYTITGFGVNYDEPTKALFDVRIEENASSVLPKVSDSVWLMDIAQSHHYTVHIKGMNMSELRVPGSPLTADKGFLPVKTMNLKYTSYENMSIPVAIFGDFPLLNKKRVSTIDLVCYDRDKNELEYELRKWESMCFPQGRYVAYMNDIAREFTYRGYNVKGEKTLDYRVFVIPAGNVTVSRDYSANDAKLINFSLVVVGDGQTCAVGNGKIPIVDHGGAGDGSGSGPFATVYANAIGRWNEKTRQMEDMYDVGMM